MQRLRQPVRLVSGLWVMLMLGTGTAFANGVPIYHSNYEKAPDIGFMSVICLATYIATAMVEYGVIYLFLRRLMTYGAGILSWVLLVNLATNPVSQFVWLHFRERLDPVDRVLMLSGIELAVVAVEFLFFRWIFRRMYHSGVLAEPVTERRALTIVLAANVASLVFAAAGLIYLSAAFRTWGSPVVPFHRLM